MVRVNVELDLPPGVELLGYERSAGRARLRGEVPPGAAPAAASGAVTKSRPATSTRTRSIWSATSTSGASRVGSSSTRASLAACGADIARRTSPRWKRKKVMYTYRFEQYRAADAHR